MNRRSFLKRASLAVGAAAISLSMLRAPKPKQVTTGGYSLRQLNRSNPIFRLKRPSDNQEKDFYGYEVYEDVIKWAGSRDVYATLYDQSGNNNAPYKGRMLI